ncbi:MAG TPA: hypothetical protein VI702_01165 [Nitrospiria bacterium]
MQKWLLYFKPIRIAPSISKDEALNPPIGAYLVLTIATGLWAIRQLNEDAIQKMGSLIYQLNLASVIFIEPFSPLIGAAFVHFTAKRIMNLEGSFRRLVLLFYYAGFGSAVCRAVVVFAMQPGQDPPGLSPENLEAVSTPIPLFVAITIAIGLYSMFVTLRLTMNNYSAGLLPAVKLMVYSTLLLTAAGIVLMGFIIVGGGAGT